jgi:hypothetical protein
MAETTVLEKKLENGLICWVADNDVTPADFARKMGYSYVHAWSLLSKRTPFTREAFGRFTVAYGTFAAAEVMRLADLPNNVDGVDILSEREDAIPVVVVTRKNGKK